MSGADRRDWFKKEAALVGVVSQAARTAPGDAAKEDRHRRDEEVATFTKSEPEVVHTLGTGRKPKRNRQTVRQSGDSPADWRQIHHRELPQDSEASNRQHQDARRIQPTHSAFWRATAGRSLFDLRQHSERLRTGSGESGELRCVPAKVYGHKASAHLRKSIRRLVLLRSPSICAVHEVL